MVNIIIFSPDFFIWRVSLKMWRKTSQNIPVLAARGPAGPSWPAAPGLDDPKKSPAPLPGFPAKLHEFIIYI